MIAKTVKAIWQFITCPHRHKRSLTLRLVDDTGKSRTTVVGHECLDCGRMWGI